MTSNINVIALPVVVIITLSMNVSYADRLHVVTTTEDLAAVAREVGGEKAVVESLARGYQDPHFVDAKPSHMAKLRRADLFVQIGKELEIGWAPALLNGARNPNILPGAAGFLDASGKIQILEVPTGPVSRAQGDVHPLGNPHYWLDPANGIPIAEEIRDALSRLRPSETAYFGMRTADFIQRLKTTIQHWNDRAKRIGLPGLRTITYHRSWSYFAGAFGLEVVGYVEPKPGIPPSPRHIQSLIALAREQRVRLIVMDPYYDAKLPERIAQAVGIPVVSLPPSVGAEREIRTYFDLFEYDLKRLGEAKP